MELEQAKSYMQLAFKSAQNSTCARRRVGAVIVDQFGTLISTGWNHSSNGISCEAKFFYEYAKDALEDTAEFRMYLRALTHEPLVAHQYENFLSPELRAVWESFKVYTKTPEFKVLHKDWQNSEIHSELSAILNAYKQKKSVENCILFSSRSPCIACAHAIIESGISTVYYTELSQAGEGGIPVLNLAGVCTQHLDVETEYYT